MQYYTGTQAELVFINHPTDQRLDPGLPLPVVAFSLAAGRSPTHIYNYAYRSDGQQGAAPFDDTVLTNEYASLQIILTPEKMNEYLSSFRVSSDVGDVLLVYSPRESTRSYVGYKLIEGRVSSMGHQVDGSTGLMPVINLIFKDWSAHRLEPNS